MLTAEGEEDWWPQAAIYPLIEAPTGSTQLGPGSRHMQVFEPICLQKDSASHLWRWRLLPQSRRGKRNYWFSGIVVERKIDDRLTVGLELFHQISNEQGTPNSTGYNIGGSYSLSVGLRLLMALGSGLQNVAMTNRFSYYAGLQATF